MSNIIDRRKDGGGKSLPNRKRFIDRIKPQIKKSIQDVVNKQGSIKDFTKKGKPINIPIKGVNEPVLRNDSKTGRRNRTIPGNDKYYPGDTHPKPPPQDGNGGAGGPDSETSEDEFMAEISMEEFMDVLCEDLELPNMIEKDVTMPSTEDFSLEFAGQIKQGIPSRLNIIKTFKNSIGRSIGVNAFIEEEIKRLEKEIKEEKDPDKLNLLEEELTTMKEMSIPFIDDIDLRYDHYRLEPQPVTSAVIFCIMDVSGSMGQEEKHIAKVFFGLLHYFLHKQYKNVEVVYIRHHHDAKEVDHDEFFDSRESGGTMVSPSLELMKEIIDTRFPPNKWNIYGCQASDGDNFMQDEGNSHNVLVDKLMPIVQYYSYIQIGNGMNNTYFTNSLWEEYKQVAMKCKNFRMEVIKRRQEITSVFREFFKRGESK